MECDFNLYIGYTKEIVHKQYYNNNMSFIGLSFINKQNITI